MSQTFFGPAARGTGKEENKRKEDGNKNKQWEHFSLNFCSLHSAQLTSPSSLYFFVFLLQLLPHLTHFLHFLSAHHESFAVCSGELTQSKYLNVGNHFKASNTEALSPPSSLSDMDRCQAHRTQQPLLISVFDQNVNQNLDMTAPETAVAQYGAGRQADVVPHA